MAWGSGRQFRDAFSSASTVHAIGASKNVAEKGLYALIVVLRYNRIRFCDWVGMSESSKFAAPLHFPACGYKVEP
ncbi:hypothetical protein PYK22_01240 [Pyrinomonas methylaliphatogenes]|jgi:hypothetical protein|uniref:Uncharacterized protein n=1 Tax=Pyrinomonas methylaliphatogenes TaxID=454194 RepID=A0A0B6WWX0_9BACT|nr:hypothetical protein PYK22_01240 [Pyrinomonas methylaliphatogenes]